MRRGGAAGWLLVLLLLASVVVAHGLTCTAVPRGGGGHAAAHQAVAHAHAAHDAMLHAVSAAADDATTEPLPSGSPPPGAQGAAVVAVCLFALLAVGVPSRSVQPSGGAEVRRSRTSWAPSSLRTSWTWEAGADLAGVPRAWTPLRTVGPTGWPSWSTKPC